MQLLVVSSSLKNCSWFDDSCSSVVRCSSAVRRNLIHGSSGSSGSSGSHGLVGSVVQPVCTVCRFAVADQRCQLQPTKHDSRMLEYFTNNARCLYSVNIFYQPIYKYMST